MRLNSTGMFAFNTNSTPVKAPALNPASLLPSPTSPRNPSDLADLAAAIARLRQNRSELAFPSCNLDTLRGVIAEVDVLLNEVNAQTVRYRKAQNTKARVILSSLENKLLQRRTAAQDVIIALAHHQLRKARLLDLPPEILVNVFTYIACGKSPLRIDGDDHVSSKNQDRERDIETIKALRLTCHLIHDLASHLLLRSITVSMNPVSLDRLGFVSNHACFSQSIRCVRVNLAFHASALANNLELFEQYQKDQIEQRLTEAGGYRHEVPPQERSLLARLRFERFGVYQNDILREKFKRLVTKAHKEYWSLWEEEKRARHQTWALKAYERTDDAFAEAVASAMARMPNATRLEMSDLDIKLNWKENYEKGKRNKHIDEKTGLWRFMVSSMRWEKANTNIRQWGSPPVEVLLKLPLALSRRGVRLTRLAVDVTHCRVHYYAMIKPTKKDAEELAKLVRDIRALEFSFAPKRHDVHPGQESGERWYEYLTQIAAYLNALLSTSHLEKLCINTQSFFEHKHEGNPLLAFLTTRAWPRLERLELGHATVPLALLESILGERRHPLTLRLENVQFQQGTWSETLDMLHAKADPKRCRLGGGRCAPVFVEDLVSPAGGDVRDHRAIFGEGDLYKNASIAPAVAYARRLLLNNPMVVPPSPPQPPSPPPSPPPLAFHAPRRKKTRRRRNHTVGHGAMERRQGR